MASVDSRIDRSAAMQAKARNMVPVLEQANQILQDLGDSASRIVLLGNVTAGSGFRPLEGYALEMSPNATFVPGHFNTQALFRGTVTLPLVPQGLQSRCGQREMNSLRACLEPCEGLAMYEASAAEALEDINTCSDFMSLAPSGLGEPNMACLLYEPRSDHHFLSVTTHMLPSEETLDGDISVFLARKKAENPGLTVSQALFPGNAVGNTMARYYNSQRAFRELVAHKLRYRLLKQFFPTMDVDQYYTCKTNNAAALSSESVHMVTNVADKNDNGTRVIFYSNAVRANLPAGAMVSAGPFKQTLWVNAPRSLGQKVAGPAAQAIAAANKLNAMPFTVPSEGDYMSVVESIVRHRTACKAGDASKPTFATVNLQPSCTHLHNPVIKHHSQADFGPLGVASNVQCNEKGDLVWRHHQMAQEHVCCHYHHHHHHRHHTCIKSDEEMHSASSTSRSLQTYSPHEMLNYMRGFESESTRRSIESLGAVIGANQTDNVFLTPLFCLSSSFSPNASLVAVAIESEQRAMAAHCTV